MTKVMTAAMVALAVAGCSPAQPTTVAATQDGSPDPNAIVVRFTSDIWPGITQYGPYQAADNKFRSIVDPALTSESQLTDSVQALGGAGYDDATQVRRDADDLRLGTATVTAVDGDKASLLACYSYTYAEYVNIADKKNLPRFSEATMQLANTNNVWYLHSITNDHVVPGCSASSKA